MKKNFLLLLVLLLIVASSNAQYTITGTSIKTPTISCGTVDYTVTTSGCNSALKLHTYFGDGTSSLDTINCAGTYGYKYRSHFYKYSGTYTVKEVLLLSGTPIDSTVNSLAVMQCNIIQTLNFMDANNNGAYDIGEKGINAAASVEVDSSGIIVDTISLYNGYNYINYAPAGTIYKFKLLKSPSLLSVSCPSSGSISFTIPSTPGLLPIGYFGFVCSGSPSFDFGILANSRSATNRQQSTIYPFQKSCTPTSGTVTAYFSPKYKYKWASPSPSAVSGNSITWNVSSLMLYSHLPSYFPLYYSLEDDPSKGHLTLGDTVHSHFSITPTSGDPDITNNMVVIIDTVKASFDPNEVQVTPQGVIPSGHQLQYTINFENTGNDTAFNINVYDTLSPDVNINSLNVLMASSDMNMSVLAKGNKNVVKFDFPNINLLDSSHHGKCDGAVIFTVNTKTGLPDGTKIDNHAGIYFDFNDVVMTNTAQNIIGLPTGVPTVNTSSQVTLYPNPANDILTINTANNAYNTLTITNTIGQSVLTQTINSLQIKVNVKNLSSGIYYVTLRGESGIKVQKFEKL